MDSVVARHKNLIVLGAVLGLQILGLAVQVRRTTDSDSSRLIRVWAVGAIAPLEKALVWVQTSTGNVWHNYFYLRGVRAENRGLKQQIERMRLEQVRMSQDADQARRLQALLAFKEQFISQTMAAQVIGSSGSEQSRSVYIDKGAKDGIQPDMAVITADGIVGKILRVYGSTSLVLLINDQTSGVGAILEKSRLQGILRGTTGGGVALEKVMSDENVPAGELVVTSGGDRIFPKGMPIGTVMSVSPGSDLFLNIRIRPAVNLSKLEEVLVVTKIDEKQAAPDETGPVRAADILAQRLPGLPQKSDTGAAAAVPENSEPSASKPAAAKAGEGNAAAATGSARMKISPAISPKVPANGAKPADGAKSPADNPAALKSPTKPATPKPGTPKPALVRPVSENSDAKSQATAQDTPQ